MSTKIRVDGNVYEVPDDLIIDAQHHSELFWYVTMRDIVGVPYEITCEEEDDEHTRTTNSAGVDYPGRVRVSRG